MYQPFPSPRQHTIDVALLYNKQNGAVICNGDIPQDAAIQLARGSREEVLAGAQDVITTLKEKAANKEIRALLCFSCGGRRVILGLETKKEIELIINAMPTDCAINGFFSYGEIGACVCPLAKHGLIFS